MNQKSTKHEIHKSTNSANIIDANSNAFAEEDKKNQSSKAHSSSQKKPTKRTFAKDIKSSLINEDNINKKRKRAMTPNLENKERYDNKQTGFVSRMLNFPLNLLKAFVKKYSLPNFNEINKLKNKNQKELRGIKRFRLLLNDNIKNILLNVLIDEPIYKEIIEKLAINKEINAYFKLSLKDVLIKYYIKYTKETFEDELNVQLKDLSKLEFLKEYYDKLKNYKTARFYPENYEQIILDLIRDEIGVLNFNLESIGNAQKIEFKVTKKNNWK